MKRILVLGAGRSAPYLVHVLLAGAEAGGWSLTVADLDESAAQAAVAGHPRGRATAFDMQDEAQVAREFAGAELVVSMLAPTFQLPVARACLAHGCHLVTVSYTDPKVRALHAAARDRGLLFLNELGLDPGIDHMSAAQLVEGFRAGGARVLGFKSYGAGVPAPESIDNPLRYAITWNAVNVAKAGAAGAVYRYMGQTKVVPPHRVFEHTWPVKVAGLGTMEAYPNRDSLEYLATFGLEDVQTMIRATLRWPGFAETFLQLVRLGLTNDPVRLPRLAEHGYRDVVKMFLPLEDRGQHVAMQVANLLGISPTGSILRNLAWLGLFSRDKVRTRGETAAAMLTDLLLEKLVLRPGQRDLVALVHEFDVQWPDGRLEKRVSTLVHEGDAGGFTAMARTVGLPAAVAARLILEGRVAVRGCALPTLPEIWRPTLAALAEAGIAFEETVHAPRAAAAGASA